MTLRPAMTLAALAALVPLAAAAYTPPNYGYGVYAKAGFVTNGGNAQSSAVTDLAKPDYTAHASAALADGKLHASVFTVDDPHDLPSYCTVFTCGWGTSADAQMWDVIELSSKNHQVGDVVRWGFAIDGAKHRGRWAWGDGAYADAYYYVGTDYGGIYHPSQLALGANNRVEGSFTVPATGTLTIYWLADLHVAADSGSYADYSNTMAFQWQLPDDVQFTSASGRFMSAAPVPEPASAAMLVAGLIVVGAAKSRRYLAR